MTDLIQCKAPIEEISPKCDDGECLDCQYYIDDPEPSTDLDDDDVCAKCNQEEL